MCLLSAGRLPHSRPEKLRAEPQGYPGDDPRQQLQHAAHLSDPERHPGGAGLHRRVAGLSGLRVRPGVRAPHSLRLCPHLLTVPLCRGLLRPHHQPRGRGQVRPPDHPRLLHIRRGPVSSSEHHR